MAGTVLFYVDPLHTYQRQLMNTELEDALADTHLYIVSRRPRTTVQAGWGRSRLVCTTRGAADPQSPLRYRTSAIKRPRIHPNGTYWEGQVCGRPVHGEAWHLAALVSNRAPDVCRHEVLYIGQAFGKEGRRDVKARTRSHSTLQAIYEAHHSTDWDVFVTPLTVDLMFLNDDHIEDDDLGPDGAFLEDLVNRRLRSARTTINTVEHLLISYFMPEYNSQLRNWTAAKHLIPLRRCGFRLISIQLQSLHELTQFFSRTRPAARTHHIVAEIPGIKTPTSFNLGTWDDLTLNPMLGEMMQVLAASANTITAAAADSPGMLRVFGDHGPTTNPDFTAWRTP